MLLPLPVPHANLTLHQLAPHLNPPFARPLPQRLCLCLRAGCRPFGRCRRLGSAGALPLLLNAGVALVCETNRVRWLLDWVPAACAGLQWRPGLLLLLVLLMLVLLLLLLVLLVVVVITSFARPSSFPIRHPIRFRVKFGEPSATAAATAACPALARPV